MSARFIADPDAMDTFLVQIDVNQIFCMTHSLNYSLSHTSKPGCIGGKCWTILNYFLASKYTCQKHTPPSDILSSLSLPVCSKLHGGTKARVWLASVFDLHWNAKCDKTWFFKATFHVEPEGYLSPSTPEAKRVAFYSVNPGVSFDTHVWN